MKTMGDCNCLIPLLEGAGQHAPDCPAVREATPPAPAPEPLFDAGPAPLAGQTWLEV